MYRFLICLTFILAFGLFRPAGAQFGEINFLTDLLSPFPPGCIALDLPEAPASGENTLFDDVVPAPTVNSTSLDGEVRVTGWRVGCPDSDFSVVMVRLQQVSGDNLILVPRVFAEAGDVDLPFHDAQLIRFPAAGNVGASGNFISGAGQTYMLAVDPVSINENTIFVPEDYNELFTLELFWGFYNNINADGELFLVDRFEPDLDPQQFDEPVLNGRYSGNWVVPGVERTGMLLQIGEMLDTQGNDVNFTFAVFFTYIDGQPTWVQGNTGPEPAAPGTVIMPMAMLEGGEFFTNPNQPPGDDIEQTIVGSLEIEPIDCNRLRVNFDFTAIGQGSGTLEFERSLRIAGYDCNPWQ